MPHAQPGSCLECALRYRARGWSVIPVEPRAKKPMVAWRRFQQELADPETIGDWFAHHPDANVAIVTGRLSGLVVLDVDPKDGGATSLAAAEREAGALPCTVEARTGGGGRHLYFRHPGRATPNRAGMRPGLDLRGDGGCIVAPPSIHPSGRRYEWVPGRAPDEAELADLPSWITAGAPGDA